MKIQIRYNNTKVRVNLWAIFLAFLLAMPYDVFKLTSILVLEQPPSVIHYRVSVFYLSLLFFPLIFYGLYRLYKQSPYVCIHPLRLIGLLLLKDFVVYQIGIISEIQLFWFSTYGNFIIATFFFITVTALYGDRIDEFLKLYAVVNIATLLFSFVTRIGHSVVLVGRSHMSALQHGETAVVLSILTIYFALKKSNRLNWLILFGGCALIITTGNRKDIGYILVCVFIYIIRKRKFAEKVNRNLVVFLPVLIIGLFIGWLSLGEKIMGMLNFARYTEMFTIIRQRGIEGFILNDSSFLGRMDSLRAGIKVIKDSPIWGGMFSVIDCQRKMQYYGYPTFPHSTVIYLYCVMGIFAVIPIGLYVKNAIQLIRINHPMQYVYIYILIRDTISGGANEGIKYLLLIMIVLNYGTLIIKQAHVLNQEKDIAH